MDSARISALLEPFLESPLSPAQLQQISIYIDLLLRWNARINLTAICQEEEIVSRHFGESFFLARHLLPAPPLTPPAAQFTAHVEINGPPTEVLDIGSGAGFPALPLKIWAPHLHLTLIESNHRKAAFLREVARALTFTNINVITARAETLAAQPDFPRAHFVTLRAVERFEQILPAAAALLAPNGTLALLIGSSQLPTLTHLPTLHHLQPIHIPKSHSRVLSLSTFE
ncbi:MAG: 16S rRNA (guanine(527)-N(7))-methyltransferase RsmG [Terriglobales bacterium]